jgi:hypothetical protein
MNFAENLQTLAPITHLLAIQIINTQGQTEATLEKKPGQAGSMAVYAALAAQFGSINTEAAKQGLTLYAEHTQDAHLNPGKHPKIDRLINVARENAGPYTLNLLTHN